MFKIIKKILKLLMDLIKDRRVQGSIIIIAVIICIVICLRREQFEVIDLIVPPLEQTSCVEYGYGCRINGVSIEPLMIYKCSLQGKGNNSYIKYLKYKIIDKDNLIHYTGLYNNLEGIKKGQYITFDNGQEYIVSTLDVLSVPSQCAPYRVNHLKM